MLVWQHPMLFVGPADPLMPFHPGVCYCRGTPCTSHLRIMSAHTVGMMIQQLQPSLFPLPRRLLVCLTCHSIFSYLSHPRALTLGTIGFLVSGCLGLGAIDRGVERGLTSGASSHPWTQHSPSWGPCQHFLSDSALPLSLACVRIGGSWLQAGGMGPDATGRGRHRRGNQADRRGHGGRCSVLVLGQGRAWGLGMGTGGRERGGQALQWPRGGDRVGLG